MWAILAPLFITTLMAVFLSLNLAEHYSLKASEQARLDALTLSLCHGRMDFIRADVFADNRKIGGLQKALEGLAPSAVAICSNPFTASACPKAKAVVKSVARAGKSLEGRQEVKRRLFLANQKRQLSELILKNDLAQDRLRVFSSSWFRWADFERERLSAKVQFYESYFSISWPKRLLPTLQFEGINTFSADLLGERNFIGLNNYAFEVKKLRAAQRAPTNLSSACALVAAPKLKVRRQK